MDLRTNAIHQNLAARIRGHFDEQDPNEVVRRSRQLMLYPDLAEPPEKIPPLGPVLVHPSPKRIPLQAYLAAALSNLNDKERLLVFHLSDTIALLCREIDIDLYEPRKKTDPVHHPDVPDSVVFQTDRQRVLESDLVIHLCHFPSTGAGEELAFAYQASIPIILIAPVNQPVTRMVTGISGLKVEIRYEEPEQLRGLLTERLIELRPWLEQRRLTKRTLAENVVGAKIKQLRIEASLSREELAKRVGLTADRIEEIEENVDTVSDPSVTTLRLIATELKTTVAELVNPDYEESILASIRSLLTEKADSVAARFRQISERDRRALLRRFLIRLLHDLEEPWR
jgi:transcriptional regulator with XRE-family HTH domain